MQTSERGRAFIAGHEGVVLKTYRCPAGVLTIGVGHTARAGGLKPVPGLRITRAEAMDLLSADLKRFEARVLATGAFDAQAPFDGATSFDFNTGRIHNATWVKRYASARRREAEASLMQWVKGGGRRLPGLVRRRRAEADLIFRGHYGAVHPASGEVAPSRPRKSDEVLACQKQLKALGYYKGALDGLAGRQTTAAVLAFQRSHPHLDADGIIGPATRAALTRAMGLRKGATQSLAAGGGSGVAVGNADQLAGQVGGSVSPAGVDLALWGTVAGCLVLLVLGSITAWRYRDEIRHMLKHP